MSTGSDSAARPAALPRAREPGLRALARLVAHVRARVPRRALVVAGAVLLLVGAIGLAGTSRVALADLIELPPPATSVGTEEFRCTLTVGGAAACSGDDFGGRAQGARGPFTALAAGERHACGLTVDGAADCWGWNYYGQSLDRTGPFTQLAAGSDHTCGLTPTGAADCWGMDFDGQASDHAGPFLRIEASGHLTCGIAPDGARQCWGAMHEETAAP